MRVGTSLPAVALLAAACGSTSSPKPASPAIQAAAPCLAWLGDGTVAQPVSGPRGQLVIRGEITTDTRPPFGIDVLLVRDGRVIGRDVTRPTNPVAGAALTSERTGRYGFALVSPGEYALVLRYGQDVVARERVTVAADSVPFVKTHVRLEALRRIPICA